MINRRDLARGGGLLALGSSLGACATSASPTTTPIHACTENLAGLAPAWIGVGTLDLSVSEDIDYARRLINAGVPTELTVVPGAFHAFDFLPGAKVSKQFAATRINALGHAFGMAALPCPFRC